jgi:hypothetical protein
MPEQREHCAPFLVTRSCLRSDCRPIDAMSKKWARSMGILPMSDQRRLSPRLAAGDLGREQRPDGEPSKERKKKGRLAPPCRIAK